MGNLLSQLVIQNGADLPRPEDPQPPGEQNTGGAIFQGSEHTIVNGGNWTAAGRDVIYQNNYSTIVSPPTDIESATNEANAELIKAMSSINFRNIQNDTVQKATPGTGQWFIESEEFQKWVYGVASVLWGTGIPGAGKTVLASIVIRYLQDLARRHPDISVAFAYIRYSDSKPVVEILAALVKQQAEKSAEVAQLVADMLCRHQEEQTKPSQADYLALLKEISKRFRATFYILDGLDETKTDAQFDLVDTLSSINAHFFITSRPLQTLQVVLKMTIPDVVFVNLVAQDQDIELLVNQQINRTPGFKLLLQLYNFKDELMRTIKEKSKGMFLHAALQIEALRYCVNLKDIRDKFTGFPSRIEEMYLATFKRIEQNSADQAILAKQMLIWVLYAESSLRVQDLQRALATSPVSENYDPDRIVPEAILLSVCCGLVTVDHDSQLIRLVHYTAKETLQRLLSDFCPQPHVTIAKSYLITLTACDFPKSTFTHNYELEEAFDLVPLLNHAYDDAGFHLAEGLKEWPELAAFALKFLRECQSFPQASWRAITTCDRYSSLHVAAFWGVVELLVPLIDEDGLDINAPAMGGHERTALIIASMHNRAPLVQHMMHIPGIDVNSQSRDGFTSLMLAADRGHTAVVDELASHPSLDVNARDCYHATALRHAVRSFGPIPIIRRLLSIPGIDVNSRQVNGRTPLALCAETGNILAVDELLDHQGIDINDEDIDGWTPLMHAVYFKHVTIVQRLLAAPGIDVNHRQIVAPPTEDMMIAEYGEEVMNEIRLREPDYFAQHCHGWTALTLAAYYGNLTIVRMLLAFPGIDVNIRDVQDSNALILAASLGHKEIVDELVRAEGMELNATDSDGQTALASAIRAGHLTIVQDLLATPGLDINVVKSGGWTPLMRAVREGYTHITQSLLTTPGLDINHRQGNGRTALALLAEYGGDDSVADDFLRYPGIDVNTVDLDGWTPLMHATHFGHLNIVQRLLTAPGIDLNRSPEDTGMTALMVAAIYGVTDVAVEVAILRLLLAAPGIELNARSAEGCTALILATGKARDPIVKELIDFPGVDVNVADDLGRTALTIAIHHGSTSAVRQLLNLKEVHVPIATIWGERTPLLLALWPCEVDKNSALGKECRHLWVTDLNREETALELLNFAAILEMVNVPDPRNGWTPLMVAAIHGYDEFARRLLGLPGVDINAKAKDGQTALMMASSHSRDGVLRQLLAVEGVEVNAVDDEGWTALMCAAWKGDDCIVETMLTFTGILVDKVDNKGQTALSLAEKEDHYHVVQLLRNYQTGSL